MEKRSWAGPCFGLLRRFVEWIGFEQINERVVDKSGRRGCAEIVNGLEAFKRSVPDYIAVEIVGERTEVGEVDIDALASVTGVSEQKLFLR